MPDGSRPTGWGFVVERFVDLGVLEKRSDAGEPHYRVDEDSEILTAARAFGESVLDAEGGR